MPLIYGTGGTQYQAENASLLGLLCCPLQLGLLLAKATPFAYAVIACSLWNKLHAKYYIPVVMRLPGSLD